MRLNKLYIELVFLDNYLINWLIILFASVLTKTQKKWGRYAIAAAIGGVYACAATAFGGVVSSFLVKMSVGLLMCVVAYYIRSGKNLFKNICAFYVTTFVFAGAIYAAAFSDAKAMDSSLFRYIIIGLGAGSVLIAVLSRVRKRAHMRILQSVDLMLTHDETQTAVRAYVDTGNLLTDPMSDVGVVFLTHAVAEALLGRQLCALLHGTG